MSKHKTLTLPKHPDTTSPGVSPCSVPGRPAHSWKRELKTQRPQRGVTPAGHGCTQSVPVIGNFGCTYGACFRKRNSRERGWLMRQKEELIWDRRGAERAHGTRSTARLLIFPFNHPASLARVRSALPSASLVPTDSSAGEASHTPRIALIQGGALGTRAPVTVPFGPAREAA